MTAPTLAACCVLALARFATGQDVAEKTLPRVATPEALAIEMAKALVSDDRKRFTALAATREEMEEMLEAAWRPTKPEDRQYVKDKVAEILADRREEFDKFQAMKKEASVKDGAAVRFELIDLAPIYVKERAHFGRALPADKNQNACQQRQHGHQRCRQRERRHASESVENQPNPEKQHAYVALEGDRHFRLLFAEVNLRCVNRASVLETRVGESLHAIQAKKRPGGRTRFTVVAWACYRQLPHRGNS